ncbi:MAG TPA: alpha/beta fold hydrolase [Chloroflexi bacterium]|nr:alpha/beta fold hydrolase [Chloroflexota bacterium]
MTQHAHLDPSPFFLEGGPVGVLLIHGFTGSPPEMRLIGDTLHERGFTVSGPLLPGHGTTVQEMNRCRWTDWTGHVEQALADLQDRCETVFVGGLSMGSLLTLYLAAHHPELAGAILYSPAVIVADRLIYLTPVLKYLIPTQPKSGESDLTDPQADLRLWSYDENPVFAAHELLKLIRRVRRLLPRVTCPLLILHSTRDQAIHPRSARYTYERVGSKDKELVTLHNSGHCITVDTEWEDVAERTYRFIVDHLPGEVGGEG